MGDKIKLNATAPVVHYDWDKLVNTFSDENSFVRLGLKETELRQRAKDYYADDNTYIIPQTIAVQSIYKNTTNKWWHFSKWSG